MIFFPQGIFPPIKFCDIKTNFEGIHTVRGNFFPALPINYAPPLLPTVLFLISPFLRTCDYNQLAKHVRAAKQVPH